MTRKVGILGTGSYVPEDILTNADLEKMVDTSDEWIRSRTGIIERHIAPAGMETSDMSVKAAKIALKNAGIGSEKISMILMATFTPDTQLPAAACIVQDKMQIRNAIALDINAACSGFICALEIAKQFVAAGKHDYVLVIGAEKLSKVTNWKDRNTCVLFGDGAGAVVLGPITEGLGIIDTYMGTAGEFSQLLCIPGGDQGNFIKMEGRDVFKQAVTVMYESVLKIIDKCNLKVEDIDFVVPHQANHRIIKALAHKLKVPLEKVYINVDRYGNMSSASIPVALDEGVRKGILKKGQRIVCVAFGAGLSWGATVIQL